MAENPPKNSFHTPLFTLDAKTLGTSLKEVSMEVIQTEDHDLEGHWFHSVKEVDFFFWKDDHAIIIKQQLSFRGLIAEWNIVEGVKTGAVIDSGGGNRKPVRSDLIEYHEKPEPIILDQAKQICIHIDELKDVDRTQCLTNWNSRKGLGLGQFADFLRHYRKARKLVKKEVSWWDQLKALLGKKNT